MREVSFERGVVKRTKGKVTYPAVQSLHPAVTLGLMRAELLCLLFYLHKMHSPIVTTNMEVYLWRKDDKKI